MKVKVKNYGDDGESLSDERDLCDVVADALDTPNADPSVVMGQIIDVLTSRGLMTLHEVQQMCNMTGCELIKVTGVAWSSEHG